MSSRNPAAHDLHTEDWRQSCSYVPRRCLLLVRLRVSRGRSLITSCEKLKCKWDSASSSWGLQELRKVSDSISHNALPIPRKPIPLKLSIICFLNIVFHQMDFGLEKKTNVQEDNSNNSLIVVHEVHVISCSWWFLPWGLLGSFNLKSEEERELLDLVCLNDLLFNV